MLSKVEMALVQYAEREWQRVMAQAKHERDTSLRLIATAHGIPDGHNFSFVPDGDGMVVRDDTPEPE